MSLRIRMLLVFAAMGFIVVPGIAVAGPATGGGTDDALLAPPNHDPLRGRDAIVGYVRSVRDVFGAIDNSSIEHLRMKGAGGEMAQVLETFTAQSGHIHVTDLSLYRRQTDGSVLITVEQFGFLERAVD